MNTITVEELAQNGTEGLQLIDVRPENDFSHGAIEGAVNLPLEKIEAGETAILKKDQPVYLYCHVGENSRDAAEILEDDGFTTFNLEGGYRAFKIPILHWRNSMLLHSKYSSKDACSFGPI